MRRGPGEPLWNGSPGASLPSFAALRKKVAPAGAKHPPSKLPSRRSAQSSGLLRIRLLPLLFVLSPRRLRRASSERTSLAPFPQNRDTAKTPYRSVAPPLQIETYRFDLRRTFRRNLPAATKRSCAVFRRIRTRNPSPSARGLWPPLDSLGFTRDERRGTKDERRELGRELRIASPVCPLDQNDGQRLHFAAHSCEYTKTPLTG